MTVGDDEYLDIPKVEEVLKLFRSFLTTLPKN